MKILEPITVGGVTFKNRVMFPPLTTGYEADDGSISAQSRALYTRLADSVHRYGAKLGVQIFHPEYDVDAINALFANGERDKVRARLHHDMEFFVNEVSEDTLLQIIEKMCACAVRANGGGETAEYLAEQGCKVSLVEQLDTIADGISSTVLPTLLENYRTYGVEQFTGHKVRNMAVGELTCENKDGNEVRIECDYMVMASGARPVTFDTAVLSDKGIAVIKIGDCSEVADISHAIKTGYDAANSL